MLNSLACVKRLCGLFNKKFKTAEHDRDGQKKSATVVTVEYKDVKNLPVGTLYRNKMGALLKLVGFDEYNLPMSEFIGG